MITGIDITPERQLYYVGALILDSVKLSNKTEIDFFELFHKLKGNNGVSIRLFTLALDWLFILGAIKGNSGRLIKCS